MKTVTYTIHFEHPLHESRWYELWKFEDGVFVEKIVGAWKRPKVRRIKKALEEGRMTEAEAKTESD